MADHDILQGSLQSEYKTIKAMVRIHCKAHHSQLSQCPTCQEFNQYALMRLDRCPYGEQKPTCNKCPIHCYKPVMREQARQIMSYAGPRMLLKHPILAIKHLANEQRQVPSKPEQNVSNRHLRNNKA